MKEKKIVSVIIPAFNCEKTISKTIQSILDQSYGDVEIIIVDDGSSDSTAKIVKEFKNIKYFYQKNSGPASARNFGAMNAKGDIVFFTDSDCIAHFDWNETAVKCFNDDVAVVAGSYGIANRESLLARCIFEEIKFRHTKLMPKFPKAFGSYNFGVKKNVFHEVGGFNTNYTSASGEDNDLSYKILKSGHKIFFEKNAIVDHYHPEKVWKYLKEQYRHGYWRVKIYAEHPKMAKGDDYTFWKDIVEIPIAFVSVVAFLISFCFKAGLSYLSAFLLILLIAIELGFGLVIIKDFFGTIFMCVVMFFRSFARMIGFTSGIFHLLLQNALQKR